VTWREVDARRGVTEWERSDGHATVRLRERAGGGYVVRFDRLVQAPEGDGYRRARVDDREAATALAAEWRATYDLPD
jgi:hypothetical protein